MQLTQSLIDTVRSALKGAKLAKLDGSLAVLTQSLADGAWVLRGSVKAPAGFYQGLCKVRFEKNYSVKGAEGEAQDDAWELMMSLSYGGAFRGTDWQRGLTVLKASNAKLPSDAVIDAWLALAAEVKAATAFLNAARPKPVITPVGLSPKVTATLTEMNLDIDLPSIKMAKIETRYRDAEVYNRDTKEWEYVLNKDGSRAQEGYHVIVWTAGIVHGTSRFASMGHCHACGKNIPSRRFVPVEAFDKRQNRLVSMMLGCDCAKNIFGIKDIGVEQEKA